MKTLPLTRKKPGRQEKREKRKKEMETNIGKRTRDPVATATSFCSNTFLSITDISVCEKALR